MNTRGYTLLSPRLESGQGVPSKTGGGAPICPFSPFRRFVPRRGWLAGLEGGNSRNRAGTG